MRDENFVSKLVATPPWIGWAWCKSDWQVGAVGNTAAAVRAAPGVLVVQRYGKPPPTRPPAGEKAG
jgi:hypothetical protein